MVSGGLSSFNILHINKIEHEGKNKIHILDYDHSLTYRHFPDYRNTNPRQWKTLQRTVMDKCFFTGLPRSLLSGGKLLCDLDLSALALCTPTAIAIPHFRTEYYRAIKKYLCTWWLQYRKLQVMLKVSPASLQTWQPTARARGTLDSY
jgi:hypothetical protein